IRALPEIYILSLHDALPIWPRDEILVNFQDICGGPLPSVWVPGRGEEEYDYALTAMPGEALRYLYEKYGPRILEANVRSFLGVRDRKSTRLNSSHVKISYAV